MKLWRGWPHTHQRVVSGREGVTCGGQGCETIVEPARPVRGENRDKLASLLESVGMKPPSSQKCVCFDSAGCCLPPLSWLVGLIRVEGVWNSHCTSRQISQVGGTKPASSKVCTLETTPMKLGDACRSSGWRSLIDHLKGICPTCPVCCMSQQDAATHAQTSE